MSELLNITGLVHEILTRNVSARNSDDVLYCKVLERYGKETGIDFNLVSTISFFKTSRRNNIPNYETISRIRRKVQMDHIELQGNANVERRRMKREKEFRAYARGE